MLKETLIGTRDTHNMETIRDLIFEQSKKTGLSPQLIAAVIQVESGGEVHACRYEQQFFNRYIADKGPKKLAGYWPPSTKVSDDTERIYRSMSLGLMQVMGQKVREYGYQGDYLASFLSNPALSIEYGCMILADCLKRSKGNLTQALLFYNGGGDKEYPNRVKQVMDSGSGHYLLVVTDGRGRPEYT